MVEALSVIKGIHLDLQYARNCKLPQGGKVFVLLVVISENSDSAAEIGGCCWAVIKTDNQLDTETLCPGEAKDFHITLAFLLMAPHQLGLFERPMSQ